MSRPIWEITNEIKKDWKSVNYAAKPYLDAMMSLDKISDMHYGDSGASCVVYFLANATSWKGEVARTIKKELNTMVKDSYKK